MEQCPITNDELPVPVLIPKENDLRCRILTQFRWIHKCDVELVDNPTQLFSSAESAEGSLPKVFRMEEGLYITGKDNSL